MCHRSAADLRNSFHVLYVNKETSVPARPATRMLEKMRVYVLRRPPFRVSLRDSVVFTSPAGKGGAFPGFTIYLVLEDR